MPSATTRRIYEDQIPSFMSVFDLNATGMDDQSVTVVDPKILGFDGKLPSATGQPSSLQQSASGAAPPSLPCDPSHRHHDSTSTQMSESADSSPTTTMSCTDSASLSDPSPSSSPDSPTNLVPLAAFPNPSFGALPALSALSVGDSSRAPISFERPMTSPSPRRRNMKGLSIQPPYISPTLPATASSNVMSEPSSPSFIKPQIPAMKRKPSQLSLKTTTLEMPQSPTLSMPPILQRRALKHSTSSPHMLSSLQSATFGPPGGMTIPPVLERNKSGLSEFFRPSRPGGPTGYDSTILEENSPIKTQIANRAAFEFEPFHEQENNEDQKTPGYPDGPIAIYSDNVYLYLEPTAEEASRFDVVINVAREVRNPFRMPGAKNSKPSDTQRPSSQPVTKLAPIPEPFMETDHDESREPTERHIAYAPTLSVTTADGAPNHNGSTPTTPKASEHIKEPEYIHIPWDHNTDIGGDLMSLCETVERKTSDGKKVLIHCQQGASRSASLIIAYGMYQNPELTVNDAYHAAQAKSRWISPNMRLMYCLQDFQKEVRKRRLPPSSALRPRSGRSPTKHRMTLSVDAVPVSKEPLSAPLPAEEGSSGSAHGNGLLNPGRPLMRPRGNSTPPSQEAISPGPSSAPSTFSWVEKEDETDREKFARFHVDLPTIHRPPPSPGYPPPSPPSRMQQQQQLQPKKPFGATLGMGLLPPPMAALSRPPPSPGFAAHRFGSFPRLGGMGNSTEADDHSDNTINSVLMNPVSLMAPPRLPEFSLFSPGFPPEGFGKSLGFDDFRPDENPTRPSERTLPPPMKAKAEVEVQVGAHKIQKFSSLAPPSSFGSTRQETLAAYGNAQDSAPMTYANSAHIIALQPNALPDDDALMSPRAETMTNNPLHDALGEVAGMHFGEQSTPGEGFFSPREAMFPRNPFLPFGRPKEVVADPRSPPTKGEAPIIRSIDDLL